MSAGEDGRWGAVITCLAERSENEVRRALTAAWPDLSIESLELAPYHWQTNPLWWSSSAVVNGALVAKFAWSQLRAERLYREGVVLQRLAVAAPSLPLPTVAALSSDPVVLVTQRVEGEPLPWQTADGLPGERMAYVAHAMGAFLATLHRVDADVVLPDPRPSGPSAQSDTATLRTHYGRIVDRDLEHRVRGWCDWIDALLGVDVDPVLLHGDLHGHNQLWDLRTGALVAVVDFETCTVGDPHFDFRYLPGNWMSPELFVAVARRYEELTASTVSFERVMAWHALTVLGDALWRTEAGVPLPDGGSAATYVDHVAYRLTALGVRP